MLIAGGGLIAVETAEFLGERGRSVTGVEMKPEIALDVHMFMKPFLMQALQNYRVSMITNAKIVSFKDSGLVFEKDGKEQAIDGFDTVIVALGTRSYNPLENAIKGAVKEVFVIGDALRREPPTMQQSLHWLLLQRCEDY